ncbi:MAG: hypothetical protein Q9188_004272 [Gyalolechia gomerana]
MTRLLKQTGGIRTTFNHSWISSNKDSSNFDNGFEIEMLDPESHHLTPGYPQFDHATTRHMRYSPHESHPRTIPATIRKLHKWPEVQLRLGRDSWWRRKYREVGLLSDIADVLARIQLTARPRLLILSRIAESCLRSGPYIFSVTSSDSTADSPAKRKKKKIPGNNKAEAKLEDHKSKALSSNPLGVYIIDVNLGSNYKLAGGYLAFDNTKKLHDLYTNDIFQPSHPKGLLRRWVDARDANFGIQSKVTESGTKTSKEVMFKIYLIASEDELNR